MNAARAWMPGSARTMCALTMRGSRGRFCAGALPPQEKPPPRFAPFFQPISSRIFAPLLSALGVLPSLASLLRRSGLGGLRGFLAFPWLSPQP